MKRVNLIILQVKPLSLYKETNSSINTFSQTLAKSFRTEPNRSMCSATQLTDFFMSQTSPIKGSNGTPPRLLLIFLLLLFCLCFLKFDELFARNLVFVYCCKIINYCNSNEFFTPSLYSHYLCNLIHFVSHLKFLQPCL